MKTILVPVDFSDVTGKVVETAAAIAGAFGSRVILVHVTEPEPQFVAYDPVPMPVPTAVIGDVQANRQQLEALKGKFGAGDVLAIPVLGTPREEILNLARKHNATLIVIGSHGHGALYQLFVGSVTAAILKEAPCPVLVVPGIAAADR
ncbi:MAG: universal stress protein [Chthoniobacteraceae bacterium]|jgi:nucleotide-binding universal stress UspA family protein